MWCTFLSDIADTVKLTEHQISTTNVKVLLISQRINYNSQYSLVKIYIYIYIKLYMFGQFEAYYSQSDGYKHYQILRQLWTHKYIFIVQIVMWNFVL